MKDFLHTLHSWTGLGLWVFWCDLNLWADLVPQKISLHTEQILKEFVCCLKIRGRSDSKLQWGHFWTSLTGSTSGSSTSGSCSGSCSGSSLASGSNNSWSWSSCAYNISCFVEKSERRTKNFIYLNCFAHYLKSLIFVQKFNFDGKTCQNSNLNV